MDNTYWYFIVKGGKNRHSVVGVFTATWCQYVVELWLHAGTAGAAIRKQNYRYIKYRGKANVKPMYEGKRLSQATTHQNGQRIQHIP